MTDLAFMPASRAAALIRRRALSPRDLVEACLASAAAVQPHLNCFVEVMAEEARRAAAEAEQAVMDGAPLGPLHGVPVVVKDQMDIAGHRTGNGSKIFEAAAPAVKDNVLITRLRAAGAIILGKTTLPEFGVKGLTDGPAFGITRNPWNTERTSGGSSGGTAAAVAAGVAPLGIGTDGAGSVRGPAACCGIVGLKATLGSVPLETARDAFANYGYAGPMTRTVTDAALMFSVVAGPASDDPWAAGAAPPRPLSPALVGGDLSGIRLGYLPRLANPRVAADVAANTQATLDALAAMGADVEEVNEPIDWLEYEGRVLYQANFAVLLAPYLAEYRDVMDPATLAVMESGATFSVTEFRNAQFARTQLFRAVQGLLARYDALVMPTITRTALPASFDTIHDQVEVDGLPCGITRQGWTSAQYPFNLTGHPAMSVPSGFGVDGLPTALQIVGRWGAELDVLRLGALVELARPWAQHRPVLPTDFQTIAR